MSDASKHLVVESLTVQIPDSPFAVFIGAWKGTAGVWVTNGNGNEQVALCADHGLAPYLCIWGKDAKGLPTAVTADGVQVHTPDQNQVFIPFADLVEAAKQNHKPEPA